MTHLKPISKALWNSFCFFAFLSLPSQALAQDKQYQRPPENQIQVKAPAKRARRLPEILPTAPDLPYLPKYPGPALFHGAMVSVKKPGERPHAYNFRYEIRDDPDTVVDWYETALVSDGWTLVNKPKGKTLRITSIAATKKDDGLNCGIFIRPSAMRGYRTKLDIRYFEYVPPEAPERDGKDKQRQKHKPDSKQSTDKRDSTPNR